MMVVAPCHGARRRVGPSGDNRTDFVRNVTASAVIFSGAHGTAPLCQSVRTSLKWGQRHERVL